MKKHIFAYVVAATVALGVGGLVGSGSQTGSLSGEVTDPSGAVIPNAKVLICGNRESEIVATDDAGHFAVHNLTPGPYEVSVSSPGFAPFDKGGLLVTAGHRSEMDADLQLPILKQAITVTAHLAFRPQHS